MRSIWTRGLAVALGLTATAHAQDAPIATIGRPVAATLGRPIAPPAAALARPIALDPAVTPVSFDRPVFRGVSPDPTPAHPVPTGPGTDPGALGMYGWRRPDDPAAPPVLTSAGGAPGNAILPPPTAAPLPPGTVIAGPAMSGPVIGGPVIGGPVIGGPVIGSPAMSGPAIGHPMPVVGTPAGSCDPCPGGAPCGGGMAAAAAGRDPFDHRFSFGVEYLLWKVKGDNTPPLVSRAASGGNPALGVPGTAVLYGGGGVNDGPRSGGRLTGGYWFDEGHSFGLEVSGFYLAEGETRFSGGGDPFGNVVARPFFDTGAVPPGQGFELVSGTDFTGDALTGSVDIRQTSSLWGYEVNLKRNLLSGCSYSLDGLVGYRQLGLDESLSIRENLVVVNDSVGPGIAPVPAGTNILVQDGFTTRNRFYGGQVGVTGEVWLYERLSLGGTAKVAVGYTNARTTISGGTTVNLAGATASAPGGLLAQGSNIGHYTRDELSVVPEVGVTLGYYVTDSLRLSVGYNFLYWSNVARVGEQVPRDVNFGNAFGNPAPAAPFTQQVNRISDFWAHGLTAGLEFRF